MWWDILKWGLVSICTILLAVFAIVAFILVQEEKKRRGK